MKKLALNPYMASWEYVPDGEPHVFGERLYVYGSHDRAHGTTYCEEDYVGWSAPLDDLSDWRYEGVIYRKDQDGENPDGQKLMFAPDVAQGPDGRYYLYYGLSDITYIGVAVSDSPAGPFSYYGQLRYQDGRLPDGLAFDPGVLAEGNDVYLYYGISPHVGDKSRRTFRGIENMPGAYMVRLDPDMKTVISDPILVANGADFSEGTSFSEHPFFEASSIRHIGDTYYFVYSSLQGHELCYATSDSPSGPFTYGGVIVSNGDVGLPGGQTAYTANNHGSIVDTGGQYYIFYHRHTHGTHFSRQGCAEKITILENGQIPQVEITSCGLNDGPLPANTTLPIYIICNLHGPEPACRIPSKPPYDENVPYLYETEAEQKENRVLYLKNMRTGSACGIKYLEFRGETHVTLTLKGGVGNIRVCLNREDTAPVAEFSVKTALDEWTEYTTEMKPASGIHAVYLCFDSVDTPLDVLKIQFS